jgi:GT2 family glycosyltransferase
VLPRPDEPLGPTPTVAALVLSYNGRRLTLDALASLERLDYPAFEVWLIDNGSTDGTAEDVASAFPAVRQVRVEPNRGAAHGVAEGLRRALAEDFDYLLVLNNDIEVHPDLLVELVRVAERDATIGVVGPKCYYYDAPRTIWSAGGRLRFAEAITRERGQGEDDRGQFDRDEEVDYVNGCAMLIRRAALEAAGLWDPVYFLCVEDADFCVRVKRLGYTCWYAHRAVLWHRVSAAVGGYAPGKTFHSARSTAIFVRRHGSRTQRLRALAWMALALPAAFLRELPRRNTAAVAAKLRGYLEGWRLPLPPPPPALAAGDGPGADAARV